MGTKAPQPAPRGPKPSPSPPPPPKGPPLAPIAPPRPYKYQGAKLDIEPLIDRIIDRLFTNGLGERGDRLAVMQGKNTESESYLGGWCESAARDQVRIAIREAYTA